MCPRLVSELVFITSLSGAAKVANQCTSSPHTRDLEIPHEAFPHLLRSTLCIPVPSQQISLPSHASIRSYGMDQEVLPRTTSSTLIGQTKYARYSSMQAPHPHSCLSEQTSRLAPHNTRSHDADYAAKMPTSLPFLCLLCRVS